jgi:hypothetical protein
MQRATRRREQVQHSGIRRRVRVVSRVRAIPPQRAKGCAVLDISCCFGAGMVDILDLTAECLPFPYGNELLDECFW